MAHFSTEYIDELLSRVDMMDVMKKHGVRVKTGSGDNNYYVADFCCGKTDFDNGRIKKDTQTYKCEACKTGGNAIHFLRDVAGMTFYEAVKELADMTHMDLPESNGKEQELQKRKELALKLAADFYHKQNNYDYFLSRGISLDVLKKYKAGYAPGGRVLRNYLESQGFTKQELTDFKLLNQKGLDKFFFRAIIPIYMNGKVVDLYGRQISEGKGVSHLYLYGNVSFLGGYDFIESGKMVTIYESFIDQLVAESNGLTNGTNPGGAGKFNIDHARLLQKKKIDRSLVIYDGDSAGREGAYETGNILHNSNIETWIGQLPEGRDPADVLSTEGAEAFRKMVDGKPFQKIQMYRELDKYSIEEIQAYLHERATNQ
ncbi:CHC2 zinc finger domain-containing protein [Priestia sp. BR_2]